MFLFNGFSSFSSFFLVHISGSFPDWPLSSFQPQFKCPFPDLPHPYPVPPITSPYYCLFIALSLLELPALFHLLVYYLFPLLEYTFHEGRDFCLFCSLLSLGALEKAMAPHSSTLAWRIPWMEEPGRLQSMGSLRVRRD